HASFPTGFYVLVEKVEFEPKDAKEPERIVIWGVFMQEIDTDNLTSVVRILRDGCMYCSLAEKKEKLCRIEWKTLAASTGKCVAFGSSHSERLRDEQRKYEVRNAVHKAKPDKPIPY